jgi:hypothetical protein
MNCSRSIPVGAEGAFAARIRRTDGLADAKLARDLFGGAEPS